MAKHKTYAWNRNALQNRQAVAQFIKISSLLGFMAGIVVFAGMMHLNSGAGKSALAGVVEAVTITWVFFKTLIRDYVSLNELFLVEKHLKPGAGPRKEKAKLYANGTYVGKV